MFSWVVSAVKTIFNTLEVVKTMDTVDQVY
jgi:hypothetical protein